MQDVYDFLFDINERLLDRGLRRFDDVARPQLISGLCSDLLSDSVGTHARSLVVNKYHNGHPDLVVDGHFDNNSVVDGGVDWGVEVKSTLKPGGVVDVHGSRDQWMMVFVYEIDTTSEPIAARRPLKFIEVYCAEVQKTDFRRNNRKTEVGTSTSALDQYGAIKLRKGWVYLDLDKEVRKRRLRGTDLT